MKSIKSFHHPLAAGALALAVSLVPAIANAQKGGGDQARDRTQDRMQTPDMDRLQTQDQDRLRIHQDSTTADATSDRLREMDRTRDRLHKESSAAKRAELRRQYRKQIQDGMNAMGTQSGPGPAATEQQRLQHMEQQMQKMQQMMRHSWEYQAQEGAGTTD